MRRLLPLLVFALCTLGVCLWWLFSQDSPQHRPGINQPVAEAPGQTRGDNTTANEPPTLVRPADQPRTVDATPTAQTPRWVPTYDERLQRGQARAEFTMIDGAGKPIASDAVLRVRLFRMIGSFALREEARVAGNSVICDGLGCNGQPLGLEPGEYLLQVDADDYGRAEDKFTLASRQVVTGTLHFPGYRRVLCLKFEDQNGQPVPWLLNGYLGMPRQGVVHHQELSAIPSAPGRVLRDPPEGRLEDHLRMPPRGHPDFNSDRQRLKTDEGRWYLAGWGGAKGSLYWSLDEELFGQKEIHFSDMDFRGSANGEITVRLNLPDDYLERILKLPPAFEADPGNASLLREPQAPPDPTDPANVPAGAARVFIKLPGPGFSAVTKIVTAPEDVKFRYETIDLDGHVGWQVSIGTVLNYRLTGPLGWHSEPVLVNTTDQPVQVITPQPNMPTWTLRTPSISPTLDAFGAYVQFGLRVHDSAVDKAGPDHGRQWLWLPRDGNGWQLQVPQTCPLSNSLRTPEYVAYAGTGTLLGGARYQYPDGRRDFDYWEDADFSPLSVKLSPRGIWPGEATKWLEQACASGLDLAPEAGMLCLRAVDRGAQGLPMVEAVLMTAEQDALLAPLRERAAKLEHPPQLSTPGKGESAAPTLDTWESVARTPEERAHVLANNAWYFAQRHIRGDAHGYLCDQQHELLAGKRYVLYLWSASRDDRKPDLRIEFEAGPGVTDLGVVVLPEYR